MKGLSVSQIKHPISFHTYFSSLCFPLYENLWFPKTLTENCQEKLLDSSVNVPASWRRLDPGCLLCYSVSLPPFSLHPAWNGHIDGKLRASYPIPRSRAKTDITKVCSIPFPQKGMQWFCQGHRECHPPSGKKADISWGTGTGQDCVPQHRGEVHRCSWRPCMCYTRPVLCCLPTHLLRWIELAFTEGSTCGRHCAKRFTFVI